jgi:hypothetical protein
MFKILKVHYTSMLMLILGYKISILLAIAGNLFLKGCDGGMGNDTIVIVMTKKNSFNFFTSMKAEISPEVRYLLLQM